MVAVSNFPTPEMIHSMLDRHSTAAWPFAGSTLLRQHFHEVPLLSPAWGVGQIGLPFSESGAISVLGLSLPLQVDSTIIASITPALSLGGALNVKVVEIAPSEAKAVRQAAALATIITLARGFTLPLTDNAANSGLKELLKTAAVTQKHDRVIVTATLDRSFFSAATADTDSSALPAPSK
jgi:hypothetical protein